MTLQPNMSVSTDEANARWLIAKYGLTRAEAKKVISTGDVRGVVRAHETWLKGHGYPAHNSPASRERLLELTDFSLAWGRSLGMLKSNPRDLSELKPGDPVERRLPVMPAPGKLSTGEHYWQGGYVFLGFSKYGVRLNYVGGEPEDAFTAGPMDVRPATGLKSNPSEKIKAVSVSRYYGGIREKRRYGGTGAVTVFWITFPDGSHMQVEGHGRTPGERKTYAIEEAKAIRAKQTPQLASNPSSSDKWVITPFDPQGREYTTHIVSEKEARRLKRAMEKERPDWTYRIRPMKDDLKGNPSDDGGAGPLLGVLVGAAIAGVAWLVLRPKDAEASPSLPAPLPAQPAPAAPAAPSPAAPTPEPSSPATPLTEGGSAPTPASTPTSNAAPFSPVAPASTPTSQAAPIAPASPVESSSAVQWVPLPTKPPMTPISMCNADSQCPPYHKCISGVCVQQPTPVWAPGE